MTIAPISTFSALPLRGIQTLQPAAGAAGATDAAGAAGTAKPDFGSMVASGLEKLQSAQATSDNLAVKATTGDLTDVHDYMIAANEASVATQLTVAVRNKAVEAFTEIMRMQM
jgi:flagellar hook-basal body complex protein FliE